MLAFLTFIFNINFLAIILYLITNQSKGIQYNKGNLSEKYKNK